MMLSRTRHISIRHDCHMNSRYLNRCFMLHYEQGMSGIPIAHVVDVLLRPFPR